MKKHVECHGRDSARNTMLKHEDIFRHQVRELHRLYQVQKMLMTELVNKEATAAVVDTKTRIWSSVSTSEITQSSRISNVNQPAACSTRAGGFLSRELSFCSRDRSNVHAMGFEFDQPAEENTFRGDRNTKQLQETLSDDGAEIDLTLSIVCGPRNKKDQSVSPCPDAEIGCSDPTGSDIRLM